MNENLIEIIQSFKETKKAIDEFVPLLTDYAEYSESVKQAIEVIKNANVDESKSKLEFSINKLENAQKELEKNILNIKDYTNKYSKNLDEFSEKLNSFEISMETNNKKTEEKLNQIISLINSMNKKDNSVLINIESSIKNIEEALE